MPSEEPRPSIWERLRAEAKAFKKQCAILPLAVRHPKTPWYARACAVLTLLYAVSPIDLIPDFIPVLGYLDDIVIVPLGLWLTFRLIPKSVLMECQAEAERLSLGRPPRNWRGGVLIFGIWLFLAIAAAALWFGIQPTA